MPKDNEVDEKVRPVAWVVTNGGESCEPWLEYEQSEVDALPAVCIAEPLYSAATVAELRAEVDRLMEVIADAESGMTALFESGDYGMCDDAIEQGFAILEDIRANVPGIRDYVPATLTGADPT